jgi:hypothetical protein
MGDGLDREGTYMTLMKEATLEQLEVVIEKGINSFIETGNALREIRDRRLYREQGFATFEDYCRERWKMSRIHAHRMIAAAGVVEMLPVGNIPISERQARELAPLPPEQQREVAADIDFSKATAKEIRTLVQEKLEPMKATKKKAAPVSATASRIEQGLLEVAAMRQPVVWEQLYECLGSKALNKKNASQWNRALLLAPWLQLQPAANNRVRVIIDYELKEICDRRRKGGELPTDFLRRLYQEFMRRRREADLAPGTRNWNTDAICKVDLINVLLWIAGEIRTYNDGFSAKEREKAVTSPKSNGKGKHDDHEDQIRTDPPDAGVGGRIH